ncbi:hypothetical protein DL766_007218 [Monosporascus sp. MC13-8B]|uniref:DUF4112 domain-containing protein n=1 Tax=Monosporascus cannonballus TaxID=155416 RepID=A0ABY0HD27_9PEZI|nr:hypothetical protein DL763_005562 [Monosporascus cannonballus]RYO90625.1 hypothetical protein DL762_002590 [Monosporascus cannonballus]RYP24880.1 hypothetical protein DL766_007218 [Monosporascus sp. MC13-8B]
MTSFVVKKLFGEYAKNHFGGEDPYFEYVPATRLGGRPSGKLKRVKKALPPGISEHDARVLTKMKRRAYRLDSGLGTICGTRVGWDSVIGLFPVVGDVLAFLLALMVIHTAKQVEGGLPFTLKARMYALALVDFIVGLIPFVGDIADAIFKSNNRNTIALEAYLREKGIKNLRRRGSALEPNLCLPVRLETQRRSDLSHRGLAERECVTIGEAGQAEAGSADSAAGAD